MRTLLYGALLCGPLLAGAAELDVSKERTLAVNVEAAGGLFAFATACDVPKESLGTLVKMDARAAGEYAETHGIAFTQDDFKRHFARGMDANRQFIGAATPASRARNCPEIAEKVSAIIAGGAGGAGGHAYK